MEQEFLVEGAVAEEVLFLHVFEAFLFGFNDLKQAAEDIVFVVVDFGSLPPETFTVTVLVLLPLLDQLVLGQNLQARLQVAALSPNPIRLYVRC